MIIKKKVEIIEVPAKLAVYQDKKSGARTVAFPFDFPDGNHGVVMLTRLSNLPWQPSQQLSSITLNFTPITYENNPA